MHACRGVWMGMLLLWCAACIIVPIIRAEGIVAVFFPYLIRRPQVASTYCACKLCTPWTMSVLLQETCSALPKSWCETTCECCTS